MWACYPFRGTLQPPSRPSRNTTSTRCAATSSCSIDLAAASSHTPSEHACCPAQLPIFAQGCPRRCSLMLFLKQMSAWTGVAHTAGQPCPCSTCLEAIFCLGHAMCNNTMLSTHPCVHLQYLGTQRAQLRRLVKPTGKRLWMSEFGCGSSPPSNMGAALELSAMILRVRIGDSGHPSISSSLHSGIGASVRECSPFLSKLCTSM